MNDPAWMVAPVVVITLAALASYASRALGAALSGRIRADSPVIEWITLVTYALMAGLVVRMIVLPVGALETTATWMRLAATALGVAVFFATRRNVGAGVFAGAAALMAMVYL